MKARTLFLFIGIVALAVTGAGASCLPGHAFGQWDAIQGLYYYTYATDINTTIGAGGIVGHFWQKAGNTVANDSGCATSNWLVPYGAGKWYIAGSMGDGDCTNLGCPGGQMVAMLNAPTTDGLGAKFAVGNATEDFSAANYYFYSSNWTFQTIPRPRVTVANKAGSVLSLNMNFDDKADAFFGPTGTPSAIITGYRLMRAYGTVDPGRLPGAYTLVQTLPYTGTAPAITGFSQDCALAGAGQDVFYAVQMQFDSPAVLGDYVGATTQVRCNSTLAKPGDFNPIAKPKPKQH